METQEETHEPRKRGRKPLQMQKQIGRRHEKTYTVQFESSMMEALHELAREDERPVSSYIRVVLRDHLRKLGRLTQAQQTQEVC